MLKESIKYPLLSISPLRTKGRDGQAGLKAVLKKFVGHTLLSISPLGTNVTGWRSRTGSIKGVHRTPFTVYLSLRDKGKGWRSRTKGSVKGVHRTPFTVY